MTPIKIPKVPAGIYYLTINKNSIQGYKASREISKQNILPKLTPINGWTCGAIAVTLKKQEIAGFVIPAGTTIYVENVGSSHSTVPISSDKLNDLLRTLYLDQLRTVKKKL